MLQNVKIATTNQKDSEFDTLFRKHASSGPRDMPKMRKGRLRSKGHDDQRRGPEDGPSTQMKEFETCGPSQAQVQ